MRMLRAFNALSYQNSTNETYLQNVSNLHQKPAIIAYYMLYAFLSL